MSNVAEQQVQASEGEFKGYGFVICAKTGMPKVDNPLIVPEEDWATLTQEEKDYINLNVKEACLRRF